MVVPVCLACAVASLVGENRLFGCVLSMSIRKQVGWQEKTAHVELYPGGSHGAFLGNRTTRISRIDRMTPIDIPPEPCAYAEEYPSSDTNCSQERQATDDASNDGNHLRLSLCLAVLRIVPCWQGS